jgi:hypothetical protein
VNFDVNSIVAGLIFGVIGLAYFRYGKKRPSFPWMAFGMALMIYPYFLESIWLLIGVGVALTVAPWVMFR